MGHRVPIYVERFDPDELGLIIIRHRRRSSDGTGWTGTASAHARNHNKAARCERGPREPRRFVHTRSLEIQQKPGRAEKFQRLNFHFSKFLREWKLEGMERQNYSTPTSCNLSIEEDGGKDLIKNSILPTKVELNPTIWVLSLTDLVPSPI